MEVGNNKEMREALEKLHTNFMCDATLLSDRFSPLFDIINHALAAPSRNCDVGTAEEQMRRFKRACAANKTCSGCRSVGHPSPSCGLAWAQLPYEAVQKGDSNGSK